MYFKGVDFYPHHIRLDFMSRRIIFMAISVVMCVLAVFFLATRGLNFGVDFKGGAIIEVRSKTGPVNIGQLRDTGNRLGIGNVLVQGFAVPTDALIRIENQTGGDDATQAAIKKLTDALGPGFEVRNQEMVGAAVSDELRSASLWAITIALLGILAYVWFRFEWQFAVGAIVALAHDVLITCGMLALIGYQFDLSVVAALLTLAGYSVNDTVVTFDRIRENLRKYKRMPIIDLVNLSLNETLSRTLLTSISLLLAVGALYIFGTEAIVAFSFVMLFGVLIGTWSSLFVAAQLLEPMGLKRDNEKPAENILATKSR